MSLEECMQEYEVKQLCESRHCVLNYHNTIKGFALTSDPQKEFIVNDGEIKTIVDHIYRVVFVYEED